MPTVEEFFEDSPEGLAIYRKIAGAVESIGEATVRVSKSQIAFRRRKGFAYVWRPGTYVDSDVPAVLSIVLDHAIDSSRFKEVAHPARQVWMHHIEMSAVADVDDEIRRWLGEAYGEAE
ncbi:MAG: hypothetical protein HOV86_20950 [Thermoactinospora sp.]|nr:hypothetical protein [Thermoactinospora sp.]